MQETWVWSLVEKIPWRREWLSIPVFLPEKFHEQRRLVGYSPWGHKELDTTEWLAYTATNLDSVWLGWYRESLFQIGTKWILCFQILRIASSLNVYCILYTSSFFFFLICSEFCHTLKWNGLEFTCLPHPVPTSHLPLHPLPPGLPRAPGPSACLMHPTWAGDLFHPW